MISSWKQPLVCQTVSTRETSRPMKKAILEIPKVTKVKKQRGRSYGSNVYLDIVVEMNPDLSVYESHAITEQIEEVLSKAFLCL